MKFQSLNCVLIFFPLPFFFIDVIRTCLEKKQLYHLIISDFDKILIDDFIEILDIFNLFTKFVQGNRYTTINYMLLLYVEIEHKLKDTISKKHGTVKKCAEILWQKLPHRFEISTDMLVAACCDHLDTTHSTFRKTFR